MGLAATAVLPSAAFAADSAPPSVGSVTPTSAAANVQTTFSAAVSDNVAILSCKLINNSAGTEDGMNVSGGQASVLKSYSPGSKVVFVRCWDTSGNQTDGPASFINVSQDAQAPSVGAVTPTSASSGQSRLYTASVSDNVGVTSCKLVNNSAGTQEDMSVGGGIASISKSYTAGTKVVFVRCWDAAGNQADGATTFINVSDPDTQGPTVSAVSPGSATTGVQTTFSGTYSDPSGVAACQLTEGGASYPMSLNNGTASVAVTLSAGSHNLQIQCRDALNNWGYGAVTMVTASAAADTQAPTVGSVVPSSVVANAATNFTATYSDNVGVVACWLQGGGIATQMSLNNGVASVSRTYAAGAFDLRVQCNDAAGNQGLGPMTTVVSSVAGQSDATPPQVGQIQQFAATVGMQVSLGMAISDNVGVASCSLYVNGQNTGSMGVAGNVATKNYQFASTGNYSVYATCADAAGNTASGPVQTVVVSAVGANDTSSPNVGQIQQAQVAAYAPATLSVSAWDNVGVAACDLYVDGQYAGPMSLGASQASRSHTFSAAGSYSVYARCRDAAGNTTVGNPSTVYASTSVRSQVPQMGSLIKLVCPAYALPDHPCKAVYYYGKDGKRHAFPNERVFFTWFVDFGAVVEVNDGFMNSIDLGKNVTYRPGTRMVKFTTVNKVYAVGKGGVLRWVTTESAASALYGSNWNTKIDDLSDAFFTNYSFGADVNVPGDFNIGGELNAASTIDANF